MIKHLFFDLDNTLFDFSVAERIALDAALRDVGVTPTERMVADYVRINGEHWRALERGEVTREYVMYHRFRELFDKYSPAASELAAEDSYARHLGDRHYYIDGAEELIRSLFGRYHLYIISNGTKSIQDRRIDSAGIRSLFDGIFISQEIGCEKPGTQFFAAAFRTVPDFHREEALVIGDSLTSDIKGGMNAGVRTVWYNPLGAAAPPDITPDYEIKELGTLPELIARIP